MGGGGHVIIRARIRTALSDPLIHGLLPSNMKAAVDAVLAKDDADWTHADCTVVGNAATWALCHL